MQNSGQPALRGAVNALQMSADLSPADADDLAAPAHAAPVDTAATFELRPLRLMYVEDNRINAMLFAAALQQRGGVELRLADDAEEALMLVRDWTPDVLVLDARLPDMNGFDLLRALRRQPGLDSTPAFMCSADAMPENLERAAEAGFVGYWSKPIDIRKVMADLERLADPGGVRLAT